ncbi:MAG: T9SS type A sorting domain-containing protein [Ignavibacteria bacterium]|nr:T9SS type A sorting domain-containing protein [Ignavibacteria bacterium]
MNTLHLLASGNDGWGFPPHAYYRTKNEGGNWSEPQLATSDGAGWGNSLFIDINSKAHILWEETSGNIYTGNLFYASNKTGVWESDSLLCDEKSFGGNFVIDANGFGYALLYNGATFDTEEILALRSSSPVTNVIEHNTFSPQQFSLSQNYPNPFNPTTTIRFEIPVGAIHELPLQTTLKIYNILGEDVATLVNENLPAGNYEREWNATNFPSGLYLYRLTAGKFSETKKLLLLK